MERETVRPAEQAKARIKDIEDHLADLESRLGATFDSVDSQLNDLAFAVASFGLILAPIRDALKALAADPNNPTSAAAKAREILEAPIDFSALASSDAVAGEPEGNPPGDA